MTIALDDVYEAWHDDEEEEEREFDESGSEDDSDTEERETSEKGRRRYYCGILSVPFDFAAPDLGAAVARMMMTRALPPSSSSEEEKGGGFDDELFIESENKIAWEGDGASSVSSGALNARGQRGGRKKRPSLLSSSPPSSLISSLRGRGCDLCDLRPPPPPLLRPFRTRPSFRASSIFLLRRFATIL